DVVGDGGHRAYSRNGLSSGETVARAGAGAAQACLEQFEVIDLDGQLLARPDRRQGNAAGGGRAAMGDPVPDRPGTAPVPAGDFGDGEVLLDGHGRSSFPRN